MVKGQQLDRVESPVVHGLSAAEKSRTVGLVDLYIYIYILIYIYKYMSVCEFKYTEELTFKKQVLFY